MASGKTHRATFCAETVAVRRNLHLELRFSIGMRSPRPSQARFGSLGFVLRVQPEVVPQALADPLPWGVPSMSLAEGLFCRFRNGASRQIREHMATLRDFDEVQFGRQPVSR